MKRSKKSAKATYVVIRPEKKTTNTQPTVGASNESAPTTTTTTSTSTK